MSSTITRVPEPNTLMSIFKAHIKQELEKQLMDEIMPAIRANVKAAAEAALKDTEVCVAQHYDRLAAEFTLGLVIKDKP